MVRLAILLLCLLPVGAGLLGAVLPAFGWFPPLGGMHFSFQPFADFLTEPGLQRSLWLSLSIAFVSTFLSYWLAIFLLALIYGQGQSGFLFRLISPLLSVPHITIAVGFLFLLQPSGWLSRLASPWLTGWERPPNLNIVPDENGGVLILALIAKELPFLLLMGLSALSQIKVRPLLDSAATLGYGPLAGWMHLVQPQLAVRLRLAVLIVMVFAISVVDMAIILAPSTPAPLAVRILTWFRDPDLSYQFIAAAAAVMQLGCALLACVAWMGLDGALLTGLARFSAAGWRFSRLPARLAALLKKTGLFLAIWPCGMAVAGMLAAIIWAFADIWRYPSA
ncbi:MAG: ABC transporter permease, partial [Candidatus Puniceispirillaceae bacterium]